MPGITTWPLISNTVSAVLGRSDVWPTDLITPFLANRPPFLISVPMKSFFCSILGGPGSGALEGRRLGRVVFSLRRRRRRGLLRRVPGRDPPSLCGVGEDAGRGRALLLPHVREGPLRVLPRGADPQRRSCGLWRVTQRPVLQFLNLNFVKMASARCHAHATPSTRPSEGLRERAAAP